MRRVETCLDEVLTLGLGDERLQLRCGESVDKAGLGYDKQEDLGACERRELVSLDDTTRSVRGGTVCATRLCAPSS